MRAGLLKRRILIQVRSATKDSFGQQATNWVDYLNNVPASITALSGHELVNAKAVNAEVTHQITLRYHPALADPVRVAAMRLIYVNAGVTRYFNALSSQILDERNRQIDLMVVEGQNQG